MSNTVPAPHTLVDLSSLIGWYHPAADRHVAETLLNSNGEEGTYLLRPSQQMKGGLTLSLRTKNAVKHFPVKWDGYEYNFGLGKFDTLEKFISHFEGQPMMAGENGVLTALRYPYPNKVEESGIYDTVRIHAHLGSPTSGHGNNPSFSATTHEGFLTKLGGRIKNWKTRWFVLRNDTLSYYKDRNSKEPKRQLDLKTCFGCETDRDQQKSHCFKLMFANRVFFMFSSSAAETKEWIDKIQWKLNSLKQK